MAMGACPGQIPMPCVPPTLMATATMVRACRYSRINTQQGSWGPFGTETDFKFSLNIAVYCWNPTKKHVTLTPR